MKRENLITITKHPSVSCYVEEGTRKGRIRDFVGELLRGNALYSIGLGSFYVHFEDKPREERELWTTRLQRIRRFARENLA